MSGTVNWQPIICTRIHVSAYSVGKIRFNIQICAWLWPGLCHSSWLVWSLVMLCSPPFQGLNSLFKMTECHIQLPDVALSLWYPHNHSLFMICSIFCFLKLICDLISLFSLSAFTKCPISLHLQSAVFYVDGDYFKHSIFSNFN